MGHFLSSPYTVSDAPDTPTILFAPIEGHAKLSARRLPKASLALHAFLMTLFQWLAGVVSSGDASSTTLPSNCFGVTVHGAL